MSFRTIRSQRHPFKFSFFTFRELPFTFKFDIYPESIYLEIGPEIGLQGHFPSMDDQLLQHSLLNNTLFSK